MNTTRLFETTLPSFETFLSSFVVMRLRLVSTYFTNGIAFRIEELKTPRFRQQAAGFEEHGTGSPGPPGSPDDASKGGGQ